jgi:hypothetical protein
LSFPFDVETCKPDIPQTASFSEFAVPVIEKELKAKAEEAISKQTAQGLTLGGATIQKETIRVFLGMYQVVYKYDDKEFSVWINGDGSRWYWNTGVPEDSTHKAAIDSKKQELETELSSIPMPSTGLLTFGFWAGIIGVLFTDGLSLIVTILCGIVRSNKRKGPLAQRAEVQSRYDKEIGELESRASDIVNQFKSDKIALRGIYSDVSGDVTAF